MELNYTDRVNKAFTAIDGNEINRPSQPFFKGTIRGVVVVAISVALAEVSKKLAEVPLLWDISSNFKNYLPFESHFMNVASAISGCLIVGHIISSGFCLNKSSRQRSFQTALGEASVILTAVAVTKLYFG